MAPFLLRLLRSEEEEEEEEKTKQKTTTLLLFKTFLNPYCNFACFAICVSKSFREAREEGRERGGEERKMGKREVEKKEIWVKREKKEERETRR